MSRVGKIARLPLALREELNRRLLEGQSAGKILPWLNGNVEVRAIIAEDFEGLAVNDDNLSQWRKGGYADWLRRRERLDRTRELAQFSSRMTEASGGSLTEGAAAIAAGQVLEVLEQVDELMALKEGESADDAKERFAAMAESLDGLTQAVSRLRKGDHDKATLQLNRDRHDVAKEALGLEREKFESTLAEKYLDWRADNRAVEIADSDLSRAEKIKQLRQLMFADIGTGTGEAKP